MASAATCEVEAGFDHHSQVFLLPGRQNLEAPVVVLNGEAATEDFGEEVAHHDSCEEVPWDLEGQEDLVDQDSLEDHACEAEVALEDPRWVTTDSDLR